MIAQGRRIAENTASDRQRLYGNTFQRSGDRERFYASVIPAIVSDHMETKVKAMLYTWALVIILQFSNKLLPLNTGFWLCMSIKFCDFFNLNIYSGPEGAQVKVPPLFFIICGVLKFLLGYKAKSTR